MSFDRPTESSSARARPAKARGAASPTRHTAAAIYGDGDGGGGGGASPRMELSTPDHQHPQMIARRKQGAYAPTAPTAIVFA